MSHLEVEQPDITLLPDYYSWHQGGLDLVGYADMKLTPDLVVAVTKLFFPDFVVYKEAVILGFNFSQDGFDKWYNQFNGNIKQVEEMINHLAIGEDLLFHSMNNHSYHNKAYFGTKLARAWHWELKRIFPDKNFEVIGRKTAYEDYEITFWQKQGDCNENTG